MAGVNRALLIGNLGTDPETRTTQSNAMVTNLRLATSESWRDRNTGERQENTEWHNVVLFGRLAEIASEYLRKGSKVYIDGRIQTRKWQDQEGRDRYTTEIVAQNLQMLDSAGSVHGDQPESTGTGAPRETRSSSEHDPNDIPF